MLCWVEGKAAAGEVHFSVSAMKRCLQTADPLLQKLGASVRDITVEPRLMEVQPPRKAWIFAHALA